MRRIVSRRDAHYSFSAFFEGRRAQAGAGEPSRVDALPQSGLELLAERAGRISAGESMVERDSGVLRGDQQMLLGRQCHGRKPPIGAGPKRRSGDCLRLVER